MRELERLMLYSMQADLEIVPRPLSVTFSNSPLLINALGDATEVGRRSQE